MFELAETYNEMMDLKLTLANRQADTQSLDNHSIKKFNHLCASSAKWVTIYIWTTSRCASNVAFSLSIDLLSCPLQVLPDVPRLSVLSGGEVSWAFGGGGAQTSSGGSVQTGPTAQQTDQLFTHCPAG